MICIDVDEDEDGEASEEPTCPKATDQRNSLEVLREYTLFSEKGGEIHGSLNRISGIVEDKISVKLNEIDIRTLMNQWCNG